jgi:hypothetical protein
VEVAMRGIILILAFLMWFTPCAAQEATVTEKEVPGAVLTAFRNMFPGAKVQEYGREEEDGRVLYEVSFTFKEKKYDVTYTPEGAVDAIEKMISVEALPAAVREAVKKKLPDCIIQTAEEITKGDKTFYEVKAVCVSGDKEKNHELKFSKDGKPIEEAADEGEEGSAAEK